jgi:X-Pro dipeptidyl-peptidase
MATSSSTLLVHSRKGFTVRTIPRLRIGFVAILATFCSTWFFDAGSVSGQDAGRAAPVFVDGQAQVVPAFNNPEEWIRHDLWVETEFDSDDDGRPDRMHVDVTRQKQTATEGLKVPVVYESSPYFSGTSSTDKKYFWNPSHELSATPPTHELPPSIPYRGRRPAISRSLVQDWVPRGFAVVHSESPGTGLSQGCPTVGGDNESLAPKAVIDWLNGRAKGFTSADGNEEVVADWCTGKVGMTGTSYNGTIPIAAATTGVAGLEAIIPVAPNTSYYHYYRSNGLIRHPDGYMGEDIDVLYNFINSGDPEKRQHCDTAVRDQEMLAKQDRVKGDYNKFWASRDYLNHVDSMKAALFMSHGFNDWNVMPEHSYRIYRAARDKGLPCRIYYHQGAHGGPPPLALMNRWFTRYLYGIENGVENEPHAYIVREGAKPSEPTPYEDYPNPAARAVRLHPSGDGRQVGRLASSSVPHQGPAMLVDDASIRAQDLAKAASSQHRLLFATDALAEPVHVSGVPRLTIKLACNKPAANLSVLLVALPVAESGRFTENVITRGWADPQNYRSLTESEPLVPGQFYELSFDLQPDDQIVPAGKQIGLMIFSSDRDFTLWPPAGTELTVDLDSTAIDLPVVGGVEAWMRSTGR